ncbi:hypothetical protein SAMN04487770_1634 [Butyrivibrio sp. ob235]|uniref:hypothetical protein n=1 Tax=Butyrivibrio sp. ob235 TaxID=1761780 RepID=UPI0008D121B0|nr:hypothetical protein [Butyrivibrio sp. ob235]SEM67473.1 hypothetical protein SAMN04487770_1634 [Butyrivibrio sp. ob235]
MTYGELLAEIEKKIFLVAELKFNIRVVEEINDVLRDKLADNPSKQKAVESLLDAYWNVFRAQKHDTDN